VSLFSRPDLTKIDLAPEREQERRNCAAGTVPQVASASPSSYTTTYAASEQRETVFAGSNN
jgi:hypothetical protein